MTAPEISIESPAKVDSRRYAVVLAGGSGTRLWPLSRSTMPKQLLPLNGSETLLQQTARRLTPMVDAAQIITVTHADHRFEVAGQLHAVDARLARGVLAEPIGRNTLPAIAWAVAKIAKQDADALIAVFSSDHAIADTPMLHAAWSAAERAAAAGYIALFGMQPTHAATGYGYIEADEVLSDPHTTLPVHRVSRFVEKPDAAAAQNFLDHGRYYWNAGMFVFRADVFTALLQNRQPKIHSAVSALLEKETNVAPLEIYQGMPEISIDYGLLEQCDCAAVVPVSMGWSDLGSWEAIYQLRAKDDFGNVIQGNVIALNSDNNLLWTEHGLLAAMGVEGLAVVQTRDATLICPRDRVADLKQLVAKVKEKNPALTETHMTVARPWGSYTILEDGPNYKTKRLVVNPGQKLSMQMHHHRAEHWVVVAGTAKIVNGDQEIYLSENQSTHIPKANRHRIENPGKIPVQIIEIQTGAYLEEDDIVRFGDIYGRA
ncbi:MAG: mannose-1-phosphate guanylyltransferase/mannose-6-phosphate isomerase [Burkholderiales bacterium]